MSVELLASIAGIVLTLAFSYIPGLSDRFDPLPATTKQAIMGGLLIVVALGAFGLSCGGIVASVTCDKSGALGLLQTMIAALVANQGVYKLTKRAD